MSGIIVLFLVWVSLASALVVEKTTTLRAIVNDFEQFGFAANGQVTLTVAITPPQANVSLFICTDKQFDQLSSFPQDPREYALCSNSCEYSADHSTPVNYRVKFKNRYHLVLVQCSPNPHEIVKADVDYTLLNPGGEQLPLGEIPLPNLYILITCVWALLVGIGGFIWARNRQYVVMLHALLYTVGVLKLAVVIVALCYWHTFKDTGKDVIQLKYLQSFIYALSETAFFCALLLISKGWRITRINLPPSEIRTISVALVLLLSTLLFFSFYNDGYYFLSLMIMYFFMLPKIFTSITRNTRALHTHMLLARYANVELNSEPVFAKIKMFKGLRTAVILYLGSILIISSMKIIMWWFLVWVTFCVSEIVTIIMIVAVCVLTRPRENGVFSPRSYFESGPFPILNMQQFDHFDELFGDQIWDPDLVLGSNPAAMAAASGHPHIDVSEAIVIEYPLPSFSKEEGEITTYFPRLAIATPEKVGEREKEKLGEREKEKDNEGSGRMRRRASRSHPPSTSLSLASSTSALLAPFPESPFLVSSSSSSPLLIPPMDNLEFGDLVGEREREGDIELSLTSIGTQTSPQPTTISSTPFSSSPQNRPSPKNRTNQTTTTTSTSTLITNDVNRRGRTTSYIEHKNKSDPPLRSRSSSPSPSSSKCTTTPSRLPLSSPLNSPAFTSSDSLLAKSDKEEDDDDNEEFL